MKKFISYFLIFALFTTTMPAQILAQDLGYKPAISFEYDSYELGKTDIKQFVANLEDDLLNYEDYYDPNTVPPVARELTGTPKHLSQSYNDFLYYNIYPEQSPIWEYTGLVPGNGTSKVDVLRILDYHLTLSEEIAELFKQNPEYKQERIEKQVRLLPVYTVLLGLFYISWAITPEALSVTIPCTGISVTIPKWVSFIVLMAGDILITDEVAWGMQKLDKRLSNLFQSVGSYKSSAIKVSRNTDLLKPVKETEYDRIEKELKELMKGRFSPTASGDVYLLKKYFKKGYRKIDSRDRAHLKSILGKFLYDVFDGDEVLINEYFRKELLRTYYALEFIKDELKNTEDPLRYNRAMIDLATTYKVQNIQIIDGRMRKIAAKPEVISFGENLQQLQGSCNLEENRNLINYINKETEAQIGAELADQTSVATTYPTMLTRAEVNYLVQLMDINQQEKDKQQKEDIKRNIERRVAQREAESNYPNLSTTK